MMSILEMVLVVVVVLNTKGEGEKEKEKEKEKKTRGPGGNERNVLFCCVRQGCGRAVRAVRSRMRRRHCWCSRLRRIEDETGHHMMMRSGRTSLR